MKKQIDLSDDEYLSINYPKVYAKLQEKRTALRYMDAIENPKKIDFGRVFGIIIYIFLASLVNLGAFFLYIHGGFGLCWSLIFGGCYAALLGFLLINRMYEND